MTARILDDRTTCCNAAWAADDNCDTYCKACYGSVDLVGTAGAPTKASNPARTVTYSVLPDGTPVTVYTYPIVTK